MNILQLYRDFNVPYVMTSRGTWVEVRCPYCGDTGHHLGYSLKDDFYHCWRCSWHPVLDALSKILLLSTVSTSVTLQKYGGKGSFRVPDAAVRAGESRKPHKRPTGVGPLGPQHRRYLERRGFDPDHLADKWGVQGTGPVALLDQINYKHRLLIPIEWGGREVSFQTRDVTDKSPARYVSCPKPRELLPYKTVLYGREAEWQDAAICVEGVTDAWRLEGSVFATFGTEVTREQIIVMSRRFTRVIVAFDPEPSAQKHARELASELRFRGVKASTEVPPHGKDPADLTESESAEFVRRVLNT